MRIAHQRKEVQHNWGPWVGPHWFSDWRDGDWRYTWSLGMLIPRIAVLRADNGDPHTIMAYWLLSGVIWTRYIEREEVI